MSLLISLSAIEVEDHLAALGFRCRFTEFEKNQLSTIPIVAEDLRGFAFPTPADNASLNLKNIKEIVGSDPSHQPAIFDHAWYMAEAFMDFCCPPGWHVLHLDLLPDSVNRPIDYARSLSARGLRLASAVEVVLMLFLRYATTQEQLLHRSHTWCEDMASLDRQVTVGAFGRNGVFLSGHPKRFFSRGLGICPAVIDSTASPSD